MKDKEETKRKLIWAVGEIIKTQDFDGLRISKIARLANVDRKLVYRYFKSLDGLLEAYIIENDYWMVFSDILKEILEEQNSLDLKELIAAVLQNQFRYFYSRPAMQRLILLEISKENRLLKSIHKAREANGQPILEATDPLFAGSTINLRAITALLIGGIYYAVLHARFNGGIISGIDINTEDGQLSILNAVNQIIGWAFDNALQKL